MNTLDGNITCGRVAIVWFPMLISQPSCVASRFLVVYGDETPPRSRAEMDALAELPNVQIERLPKGKLSIHEEFPASVASIIRQFLMG